MNKEDFIEGKPFIINENNSVYPQRPERVYRYSGDFKLVRVDLNNQTFLGEVVTIVDDYFTIVLFPFDWKQIRFSDCQCKP